MGATHHPLAQEFPEYKDRIHELKTNDSEFHDLLAHYDDIDKEIYRIEQNIEPTSDEYAETLKKKRVFLKDKLLQLLKEDEG